MKDFFATIAYAFYALFGGKIPELKAENIVTFRMWGGEVVALFPFRIWTTPEVIKGKSTLVRFMPYENRDFSLYHEPVDFGYVMLDSRQATKEESDLLMEELLTSISDDVFEVE